MKTTHFNKNISGLLFSIFAIVLISSCTVYQNIPDTDGIYSSGADKTKIIIASSQEHKNYENNYFTKELERIDQINGTDIFTDIETYSSSNETILNSRDSINNYDAGNAWGYSDNNAVVVDINLTNNDFGWNNYWNFYDPYFSYGYFDPWYGSFWRPRWRNRWINPRFWGGFGYYSYPYFNRFYPYYYRPPYWSLGRQNFYRSRYAYHGTRNYNYGKRSFVANSYNSNRYGRSRRSINSNGRITDFINRRSDNPAKRKNPKGFATNLKIDKNRTQIRNGSQNILSKEDRTENSNSRRRNTNVRSGNSTRENPNGTRPSRRRTSLSSRTNFSSRSRATRSRPVRSPSTRVRIPSRSTGRPSSGRSSSRRGGI